MVIKDYYKILGFDSCKVSAEEIKVAYRELAKKYHPDVNKNNTKAEARFKDISEAYNTLSDIKQRRKYDRIWRYYIGRKIKQEQKNKDAKIKDFIKLFFGEGKEEYRDIKSKEQPEKGENIYTEITASLTEAFYGGIKEIKFKTVDNGSKVIKVKIPAGIRNNEKIRLINQGKPGKNGGKNGDLLIKIKIKNMANLRLDGINLHTDLPISPWESALSTQVKINGLDEEITIDIPKGIQSGETIVIPEKGYKNGKGGRGDLIAHIKIMIPQDVNEEEIKLFKKLKEISSFNPRKLKIS